MAGTTATTPPQASFYPHAKMVHDNVVKVAILYQLCVLNVWVVTGDRRRGVEGRGREKIFHVAVLAEAKEKCGYEFKTLNILKEKCKMGQHCSLHHLG